MCWTGKNVKVFFFFFKPTILPHTISVCDIIYHGVYVYCESADPRSKSDYTLSVPKHTYHNSGEHHALMD